MLMIIIKMSKFQQLKDKRFYFIEILANREAQIEAF